MYLEHGHKEIYLLKTQMEELRQRVLVLEGQQDAQETYQMEQNERGES